MSKNPVVMALLCGAVAAWLSFSMATSTERPSTALAVLQYILISAALLGLIGAIKAMSAGKSKMPDQK